MAHRSLIITLSIAFVTTDEFCQLSESCIGRKLNDTGSTRIQGYKAASNPSTSFAGGSIKCDATYSCNSMSFIHAKFSEITCNADNACSNTTMQSNTSISCSGAHSCSNSHIIHSQTIECIGSRSCENSNITGAALVTSKGMLALYKSVIDTLYSAVSVINIILLSHLAAYGASFICRESHECHIYCQSIDACHMFYIQCIGTCEIHKTSSDYRDPITNFNIFNQTDYNNLTLYTPFDYNTIKFAPYTNLQCIMDQWSFDDQGEEANMDGIVVTVDNEGPVCCRGHASCIFVGVIEYRTQMKKDLICSAHKACSGSMVQNINDMVYCHGRYSCRMTVIHYVNNVHCGGVLACDEAVITGATNIICHGLSGCLGATVISGGVDVNIYAFAERGARNLKLYCNDTDHCIVHCIGSESCSYAILLCNDNCIVHCYDADENCPTLSNQSVTATVTPIYNSFYTSFYNKDPPTKSDDNILAITLLLVGGTCAVVIVIYFAIRCYLKYEAKKQTRTLSAKLKRDNSEVDIPKTHRAKSIDEVIEVVVMEEDGDDEDHVDEVKHVMESSHADSLCLKDEDVQVHHDDDEEIQNEGVEQEGVPGSVQMSGNQPCFGDGIVMKREDYSNSEDDDSDNIYADINVEKKDGSHANDNEGATTTTTTTTATLSGEDVSTQSCTENGHFN